MFKTPILLITFNRPNHTRCVLESIRVQQPEQLFVFQDGARENIPADAEKCAAVRQVINEMVDWPCQLYTNFSDTNLGCGPGPATAITWFFDNVEQGIILEDDCLPHPDFYQYCEELLQRYKNSNVMFIGSTIYNTEWTCEDSYAFSHYLFVGAWASWRRAWNSYDVDLKNIDIVVFKKHCKHIFYSSAETNWWVRKVKEIQTDTSKKSYWDYQMQIHVINHEGIIINSKRNMISNIGFDAEGTHTIDNADGRGNLSIYSCMPLSHPKTFDINKKRDYLFFAKARQLRWDKRIIKKLYDLMYESDGVCHNLLMKYKQMKHR